MSEFFRVDSVPDQVLAQLVVLGIPLPIWWYKRGNKIRIGDGLNGARVTGITRTVCAD